MASIKLGAMVADIRGKLNGNYFAKRHNTIILARCGSKLTKADAGRTALQANRNNMAYISSQWKGLGADQHLLWNNAASLLTWYSKTGEPYTPTGYQYYCQCNANRTIIGKSLLGAPVPDDKPIDVNTCQIGFNIDGNIEYANPITFHAEKYAVISASFPNSTGVKWPKGGLKQIAVLGSNETGPVILNDSYIKVFGGLPRTGMYFFKVEIIDQESGIAEGSKLTKADAGLV